jgi:excisionase family DNA binding protein
MSRSKAVQMAVSPAKILLTVEEAAEALSLGRTYTYELVLRKQIGSVKVGRRRRIPVEALHDFVARQLNQM